jgi:hypothetical protein
MESEGAFPNILPVSHRVSQKVEEYENLNCEDEMARLDFYAIDLQSKPQMQAYIIVYGGRFNRRGEVQARMARIKFYLTTNRQIKAERLYIIHGGYRKDLTVELWLKSPDEPAPLATPTVRSKDVRFKKGKIKKWEYNCEELG